MMSGKQRRAQIKQKREKRKSSRTLLLQVQRSPLSFVVVGPSRLAPDNSYGQPDFVRRGYYQDKAFQCGNCGKHGVWTAERQKWWYEVAQGGIWTTATLCRECRAERRLRREIGRATWYAGVRAKLQKQQEVKK